MTLKTRLLAALVAMALAMIVGVTGYHFIEGWSLFDSLYMTVITLATVGFGETHPLSSWGRVFTIFLILGGIGILTYSFSTFTAFIVEGELGEALRRKRMEKKIQAMSNHYIVCGGGRTGRYVIDELQKTRRPFVVIDSDPALVDNYAQKGCLALDGDASQDEVLKRAGIERAKGLAACLSTDQDNLFVIITAKGLNPGLRTVSTSIEKGVGEKLYRSGADAVVSPNFIGGLRIASELIRPTVVSFLDNMLRDENDNFRVEEVTLGDGSSGRTLGEILQNQRLDLMVLAVRPSNLDKYLFNPRPETRLLRNDILVLMGRADEVQKLQKALA